MAPDEQLDRLGPAELRRRNCAKWNTYDPEVLALWVAEMDLPTAPVVREAVRSAVEREEFGYPSAGAEARLGEALARWSAERYCWPVDPARVHVLPDVLKGVELGIDAYTPPDAPIVLPTPAYMPFFEIPKVVRRPLVEVPMMREGSGRHRLDLEGIDRAFAGGAGSLILCQPHNPLGRRFSRDELAELSQVVARHGARVVSDEIHAPLTFEAPHLPYASVSEEAASHTLTITSASKAWNLPGLKCAVAITASDLDERRFSAISPLRTHGASTLGIAASTAAFESGGPWLETTLAYLSRNRLLLGSLLAELLPEVGFVPPEATYLAWLDFAALELEPAPAEFFLARAKVALNPGLGFGRQARTCARLNFGTTAAILERAVEQMAGAVRGR